MSTRKTRAEGVRPMANVTLEFTHEEIDLLITAVRQAHRTAAGRMGRQRSGKPMYKADARADYTGQTAGMKALLDRIQPLVRPEVKRAEGKRG